MVLSSTFAYLPYGKWQRFHTRQLFIEALQLAGVSGEFRHKRMKFKEAEK
jgi:hypothetical protein